MGTYIILLTLAVFLLIPSGIVRELNHQRDAKDYRISFALEVPIIVTLVFISGFRYFVGTDYLLYHQIFSRINTDNWFEAYSTSKQEFGFTTLSLALKSLNKDPQILFFTTALLTVLISFVAIRRMSRNTSISIFLFITFAAFLAPMNIVRQGLAVALVYLAISYYSENKWKASIAALFAASIHSSSIIAMLIILLVRRRRISTKLYLFGLVGGAFVLKSLIFQFPIFQEIATQLNPRYGDYLAQATESGIGTYLVLALHALTGLIATRIKPSDDQSNSLISIYVSAIPFIILGTSAIELTRLSDYFIFSIIFVIPMMFRAGKTWIRIAGYCLLTISIPYYFFYINFYGGISSYQDYFGILSRANMEIFIPR